MAKESRVNPANENDELKLEELRRALIEGEESGVAGPFDFDAFIARKRDRVPPR